MSKKPETWQDRLASELEAKEKSMREVSLAAGKGAGYVHSLLTDGKNPRVENLLKVCEAANISLYYVLYGVKVDRELEEIIRLLQASSKAKREGLLQILRDPQAPEAAE